jgi:hypothetical protein
VRVTGGELVVSLVRERAGVVTATPTSFARADRFKVRVTCSPGVADVDVDVVVFQDGEAAWPLAPTRLRCGNQVVVPGALGGRDVRPLEGRPPRLRHGAAGALTPAGWPPQ